MFQVLIVSFKHEFELVSQSHVTPKELSSKMSISRQKKKKKKKQQINKKIKRQNNQFPNTFVNKNTIIDWYLLFCRVSIIDITIIQL